jgi:hypothetical protein
MQLGISVQPTPVLRVCEPSAFYVSVPSPPAGGMAVPYTRSVGSDRGAQALIRQRARPRLA